VNYKQQQERGNMETIETNSSVTMTLGELVDTETYGHTVTLYFNEPISRNVRSSVSMLCRTEEHANMVEMKHREMWKLPMKSELPMDIDSVEEMLDIAVMQGAFGFSDDN
tara:strand:- start:2880 stop:3209 length:330 start_codon:yes stop_codon:yes gene_type:complete